MQLTDVNVLVYAYREDAVDHAAYRQWLQALIGSKQAFAVSELVLSGFLRVVTHPRVFDPPSPLKGALEFVEAIRSAPVTSAWVVGGKSSRDTVVHSRKARRSGRIIVVLRQCFRNPRTRGRGPLLLS